MKPLRVSALLKGRASTAGPSPGPHPRLTAGQPSLRSGLAPFLIDSLAIPITLGQQSESQASLRADLADRSQEAW